jgi:membrane associated rhomboid family serine protease
MSIEIKEDPAPEQPHDEGPRRVAADYPWFSIGMILSYTVVFTTQVAVGMDKSIILAGDDKSAFLQRYEFWRWLTGAALHGGLLHYLMNSYAFYSFGSTFEILTSRFHVPVVFLLSAIGGSALSLIANPDGISVGASGGIIGLVGYLAVYSFKRRQFITGEFRRGMIFNIGFILFYGFVLAGTVDNFAHIGGLVTGAIYALVQVPIDPTVDPRTASRRLEMAGSIAGGIYLVTCLFAAAVILGVI